jgi:ferric-dicitrate binding protein FerR (iron transport regulator)
MASMRAYEIHTFQQGKWKIDSIFDDRELALFEAGRMDESGRHPAIRVIEEDFDEKTQKAKIRTIFRGSKIDHSNAAALEKTKEVRQQVAQQKQQIQQDRVRKRTEAVAAEKRRKSNPFRLISLFAAIALLGLGAVFGLRYLYDKL